MNKHRIKHSIWTKTTTVTGLAVWAMLAVLCVVASSEVARADVLGFYFGAGAGQGDIKIDQVDTGTAFGPVRVDKHHATWKALLGVRPISVIGAELEYFDFGNTDGTISAASSGVSAHGNANAKARALFAVGYLPLPVPLIDVYGKAGLAHLQANASGFLDIACITAGTCGAFQTHRSDNTFAWGGGVQVKLPITSLSVRAEYEHFNASRGAPSLLSASLLWRF